MSIWLITVNYKNIKPTKKLMSSLEGCIENEDLKVFIADNSTDRLSSDELIKIKNDSKLNVFLYFFKNNMYYWPAVEHIISTEFAKNKKYPDRIIICNNDIIFTDTLFFKKLKKYTNKHYPIIGPAILNKNQTSLNPFLVYPLNSFKLKFWDFYYKSYLLSRVLNFLIIVKNFFKNKNKYEKASKVYAAHGSFIIFSDTFFNKGGFLDNNFKLFCEELSNAEIAKKIGCNIFYLPELKVFHDQHISTGIIDKKKLFLIAKNSHDYFINHYIKK